MHNGLLDCPLSMAAVRYSIKGPAASLTEKKSYSLEHTRKMLPQLIPLLAYN